ncbi:uncharacterized protein LOC130973818 isoform X1 [Arachis stenosperma]|uniref:uncharacterized protein LOC130973818 isoform X1 n=1 Tax=Arachis stenosperma TaxID=217475 RepID=UPI0025ACA087|nr:uncharacterized protein LOC130973818 isoform X1 [Arachis stenosperma]XP_057754573.1 uncharacterized protein LOC130973818 isoform X1 [Arachis stenosperma]XP_057754633.1 uncharacterized protein LOC130973818 isoform X1 [Arachis stenosperma]
MNPVFRTLLAPHKTQRRSTPSPSLTLELVLPLTNGELSPSLPSNCWTAPAAVVGWSLEDYSCHRAALHHRRRTRLLSPSRTSVPPSPASARLHLSVAVKHSRQDRLLPPSRTLFHRRRRHLCSTGQRYSLGSALLCSILYF